MAAVVSVLQRAIMGQAAALLISGEAGVGKTVLVDAACSQVSDVADVIWGSCLPLTSLAVPFLPLRSALREWAGSRGIPMPVPDGSDGSATGYGPVEFDAGWTKRVCSVLWSWSWTTCTGPTRARWTSLCSSWPDARIDASESSPPCAQGKCVRGTRCAAGGPMCAGYHESTKYPWADWTGPVPRIRSLASWVVRRTKRWWMQYSPGREATPT